MPSAVELAERSNLRIRSRELDAVRSQMEGVDLQLEISSREAPGFDLSSTALYLPNGFLCRIGYGAAAAVRAPPDRRRDDYFIHLPIHGSAEVTNSSGTVVCAAQQGVISSPEGHLMHSERGSARFTLSFTRSMVERRLATLLGDWPTKPLVFASAIHLDAAAGRRLFRYQQAAWADLDDPDGVPNPLIQSLHEELIVTALLVEQPHTYGHALARLSRTAVPRDVARAVEYMHAHLDQPITLADLVSASGVPGRTLLKHFENRWGMSPMRYLRKARLERAQDALLRAEPGDTVTRIAMSLGFHHLGRFSSEYRRRFGESPSETRRRSPSS